MNSIYLQGSETVEHAASAMRGAADQMDRAALNMAGALERHEQFLAGWLQTLEQVLAEHRIDQGPR